MKQFAQPVVYYTAHLLPAQQAFSTRSDAKSLTFSLSVLVSMRLDAYYRTFEIPFQ